MRNPQLEIIQVEEEGRLQDANHGVVFIVGRCDCAANDARIRAEPAPPDRVCQDRDGLTLIGRTERSAQRGFRAKHFEEAGSRLTSQNLRVRKREPVKVDRLNAIEDSLFAGPIEQVGGGNGGLTGVEPDRGRTAAGWRSFARFPEHDDAIGIVIGKRPQQDGVDETEHRGGGADREAQDSASCQGEAWTPTEQTGDLSQFVHWATLAFDSHFNYKLAGLLAVTDCFKI